MLQAHNITYEIGGSLLLDNINASFNAGSINLIIGPNGAGKSTLIKVLSGQQQPTSGQVLYDNKSITTYKSKALAGIRAVLSQNSDISFPLKVWEVVMMGRYPHFTGKPEKQDEEACYNAMLLFDVWNMASREYTTLSGGEKQRVQFARVMSQIWYGQKPRFRYLLLDEPLTFLDIHYQHQFMQQVKELIKNADLIIIGVVHDLNMAAKYADILLLLNHGKIIAQGKPQEVLNLINIQAAYQMEPSFIQHDDKHYLIF